MTYTDTRTLRGRASKPETISNGNGGPRDAKISPSLPTERSIFYGGQWHVPNQGRKVQVISPATGERLTDIYQATPDDVDAVVAAARSGFHIWRDVKPKERGKILREMVRIIRANADELAMIEAADCGNPVDEMRRDMEMSAELIEMFAGFVTELKGASVPFGPDMLSYSVREPYGVVVRIAPFNHPFVFSIGRLGAPLAAGNVVISKPPEQAPLSALRAIELFEGLFPAGVINLVPGDRDLGAALAAHRDVNFVAVTGSVPTGKAVMKLAADDLKRTMLELGGKNALMAYPDSHPEAVAAAMVRGMNFTWCGQSCGSTSRAFVHADIYDRVVELLPKYAGKFVPGLPTDPKTTMGCLINGAQYEKVLGYIQSAKDEGARLVCGGKRPSGEGLQGGFFLEPTIFADVTKDMRIAREEIFGPVLSVFKWQDEEATFDTINAVDYGLTFSVFTRDVARAHRAVARAQAGFCWINEVSKHAIGSAFGGYKQSGIGKEECLAEILSYTQEKNVYVNLAQ